MHGYEMMKALEERSHGFYTPSAGSIYPTLQMLEDRGLVSVAEVEGKKVYSITEEGKAFLNERKWPGEEFAPPWMREMGKRWNDPEVQALRSEAMEVMRLFAIAGRTSFNNPEKLAQLRAILERTHKDLADLIDGTDAPKDQDAPKA
jgi:DNA-binding PadR family transcriptional regulator